MSMIQTPVVLNDKDNDHAVFLGADAARTHLVLIVGNVKDDEVDDFFEAFQASVEKEFNDVESFDKKRNEKATDRWDLLAMLGPYPEQHRFDSAQRRAMRYIEEVLGGGPNQAVKH
jgi:hypothetical protein